MLLDFLAGLADQRIGGNEGVNVLSNAARSPASYLLASVLPERDVASYTAKGGSMTVRSTTVTANIGKLSTDELQMFRALLQKLSDPGERA